MNDEATYGPELHRLGFGDAVEADLLTDYKVVVLAVDEKYVAENFQHAMAISGEIALGDAAKLLGCWNGLVKHFVDPADGAADPAPMLRAVAFAKDIRASKQAAASFPVLVERAITGDPARPEVGGRGSRDLPLAGCARPGRSSRQRDPGQRRSGDPCRRFRGRPTGSRRPTAGRGCRSRWCRESRELVADLLCHLPVSGDADDADAGPGLCVAIESVADGLPDQLGSRGVVGRSTLATGRSEFIGTKTMDSWGHVAGLPAATPDRGRRPMTVAPGESWLVA